ncbi:hypothetical protein B0T17DRAFT_4552 [Bombardia bombarda]|uniref:Uncharacterized protein n=1 Tax=Bombardia bombarda TaxID=252184 RepID=A0AA40CDN3_9PEZI|nr:hypothetical protein B0T17DRAFT_4552 [Bombardia bombarda]
MGIAISFRPIFLIPTVFMISVPVCFYRMRSIVDGGVARPVAQFWMTTGRLDWSMGWVLGGGFGLKRGKSGYLTVWSWVCSTISLSVILLRFYHLCPLLATFVDSSFQCFA